MLLFIMEYDFTHSRITFQCCLLWNMTLHIPNRFKVLFVMEYNFTNIYKQTDLDKKLYKTI